MVFVIFLKIFRIFNFACLLYQRLKTTSYCLRCTTTLSDNFLLDNSNDINDTINNITIDHIYTNEQIIEDAIKHIECNNLDFGDDLKHLEDAFAINDLKDNEILYSLNDSDNIEDFWDVLNLNFSEQIAVKRDLSDPIDTNNSAEAKMIVTQDCSKTISILNTQNDLTQSIRSKGNDTSQAVQEQQIDFNIIYSPIKGVNDLNIKSCLGMPQEEIGIDIETAPRNLQKRPRHSFNESASVNKDFSIKPYKRQFEREDINRKINTTQNKDENCIINSMKIKDIINSKRNTDTDFPHKPKKAKLINIDANTSSQSVINNKVENPILSKTFKPIPVKIIFTNDMFLQIKKLNEKSVSSNKHSVNNETNIFTEFNIKNTHPNVDKRQNAIIKPKVKKNFITSDKSKNNFNRANASIKLIAKDLKSCSTIVKKFDDKIDDINKNKLNSANDSCFSKVISKQKPETTIKKLENLKKNMQRSLKDTKPCTGPEIKKVVTKSIIFSLMENQPKNIFPVCKMCQLNKKAHKTVICNINQNKPYRFVLEANLNPAFSLTQNKYNEARLKKHKIVIISLKNITNYLNEILPSKTMCKSDSKHLFYLYKVSGVTESNSDQVVKYLPFVRYFLVNQIFKIRLELRKNKNVPLSLTNTIIKTHNNNVYLFIREIYLYKIDILKICTYNFVILNLFSFVHNSICISMSSNNDKICSIIYEKFYNENIYEIIKNKKIKFFEEQIIKDYSGETFLNIQNIFILIVLTEDKIEDLLCQDMATIEATSLGCSVIIDIPKILKDEIVNHFINKKALLNIKENADYIIFLHEIDFFVTYIYENKDLFKVQMNKIYENFAELDFDYIKINDIINNINYKNMFFKKHLDLSVLQQYLIKYIKSLDDKNPIHTYISELKFFGLYLENEACNKDLEVPKLEIIRYVHFLYIFKISTLILIPVNFSELLGTSTCEFNMFLHHPIRLIFLKIRHELQRLFAHIISIFIANNCLELFIEKYLTERLLFTFFNQDIKCETNKQISIFGKNSNCFIFSKLFFLFAMRKDILFESILRSPSFDRRIIFFLTQNTCNRFMNFCLEKNRT
ncbi:hypothetical protein COBT_000698 [Conglomerata obtusa]